MKQDFWKWSTELDRYAENCRQANPVADRAGLSRAQIMQLSIIKGSLLHRLNNIPAAKLLSPSEQESRQYCIIFTSNSAGLVAAKEIEQKVNLPVCSLHPEELHGFLQLYPDTGHKYHIHIWSHFLEELDKETARITERYPLYDKEKYWLHVEGIMCGPRLGRGTEHLWRWNGNLPKLLKKNLFHWAS